MDLIGIPKRITVGRRASEGVVEYKERCLDEVVEISKEQVLEYI